MVAKPPLFSGLMTRARAYRDERVPRDRWIIVTVHGHIQTHPKRRADPNEWAYALAHGLLHLAFGHLAGAAGKEPRAWTAACCLVVSRFLAGLTLWQPVSALTFEVESAPRTEDALYAYFLEHGVPSDAPLCAPEGLPELPPPPKRAPFPVLPNWER